MDITENIVSVVIPTLNSGETLESCLISLKANHTHYKYEIIVVDAGSEDDTLSIAGKYTDKLINGAYHKINRNLGINASEGEIICFTDSDCIVPVNWIDDLVGGLQRLSKQNIQIVGVGGGNCPPSEYCSEEEHAIAAAMRSPLISFRARNTAHYDKERAVTHNPPMNSACFKRIIQEIGGFREEVGFPEDLDLDARIIERGYRLYFLPGIDVVHKHKTSYDKFAKQMRDFGCKRVKANRTHPHIASFYHYGPMFLAIMLYTPFIFIPGVMALINALITSFKERCPGLFFPIIRLTLSFYRHYGLGELSILLKGGK